MGNLLGQNIDCTGESPCIISSTICTDDCQFFNLDLGYKNNLCISKTGDDFLEVNSFTLLGNKIESSKSFKFEGPNSLKITALYKEYSRDEGSSSHAEPVYLLLKSLYYENCEEMKASINSGECFPNSSSNSAILMGVSLITLFFIGCAVNNNLKLVALSS